MKYLFYISKKYKQDRPSPTPFYWCGYTLPPIDKIPQTDAATAHKEHWNTEMSLAMNYDTYEQAQDKLFEIASQKECVYAIEKYFLL